MQLKQILRVISIFIALILYYFFGSPTLAYAQECGGDCSVVACGTMQVCQADGSCSFETRYCTSCGGNGCSQAACPPGQYLPPNSPICRDIGTGGGVTNPPPECDYSYIQNCPAGYTATPVILSTSCVSNLRMSTCSGDRGSTNYAVGSAQTTGACCRTSYDSETGYTSCTHTTVNYHQCIPTCATGTQLSCGYTSGTVNNSCFNPTNCGVSNTYVSHVSNPSAGVCYVGCSDYNPNTGNCRVGASYNVYNVTTTCNQLSCSCVSTCANTAPPAVIVTQGSSATTANVDWQLGSGGTSQRLYVGTNLAAVNGGCVDANNPCLTGYSPRTVASGTTSDIVTGLASSTTYYFRVSTYTSSTCNPGTTSSAYTTPANNSLSGVVYLDDSNNCTGTAWNAGSLGALSVSVRDTAFTGSVGSDGRFSIATGTTTAIPYLDLSTPPAGYTCSTGVGCNNNCSLSNLTSPSSTNYFYLSPRREAWWQTVGGSIYANGSVRSEIPSASLSLIAPGAGGALGALMRSSGTVDTGTGLVSSEGYSAQTTYRGKTMNYDFFAAHMGVTNNTQNDWGADTMNKPVNSASRDFYYINPTSNEASVSTPWVVANGESYVVFVNGDLRIASDVTVEPGGYLSFIVNGNVAVSPAVVSMQGLYVVDGTFASESNGGTDLALEVEGSVVAWGGVSLGRDLASTNTTLAAERFTYRPDLLTNMPEKMKVFALKWEEVVPGTFDQ